MTLERNQQREFEARARGENSSFSRLNPRGGSGGSGAPAVTSRAENTFRFPWGGSGDGGQRRPQQPQRSSHATAHGARVGAGGDEHDERAEGEWPAGGGRARDGGGNGAHMPGLLRGLGASPGRGLLFSRMHGGGVGGERGAAGDEMGPAEFGLLMGEEGDDGGPGASNPLLADDWASAQTMVSPFLL